MYIGFLRFRFVKGLVSIIINPSVPKNEEWDYTKTESSGWTHIDSERIKTFLFSRFNTFSTPKGPLCIDSPETNQ